MTFLHFSFLFYLPVNVNVTEIMIKNINVEWLLLQEEGDLLRLSGGPNAQSQHCDERSGKWTERNHHREVILKHFIDPSWPVNLVYFKVVSMLCVWRVDIIPHNTVYTVCSDHNGALKLCLKLFPHIDILHLWYPPSTQYQYRICMYSDDMMKHIENCLDFITKCRGLLGCTTSSGVWFRRLLNSCIRLQGIHIHILSISQIFGWINNRAIHFPQHE